LKQPRDLSKAEFGTLLFKCAAKVFRSTHRNSDRANVLLKASVVDELHKSGPSKGEVHKHFGMLADKPFVPHALQQLLRRKYKIAVHFSMTHDYYWTTFVYFTVPGGGPDGKTLEDLDPQPWLSAGHPPVADELLEMPRGARRSDKIRVRKFLGIGAEGRGGGDEAELTFEDFSAALVERGLRTRQALFAWISRRKALATKPSPAADDHSPEAEEIRGANDTAARQMDEAKKLNAFVHKHIRDLGDRIWLAWELHDAVGEEERAALSAWETVVAAPGKCPCVCDGQWIPLTEDMLQKHCATGRAKGVDPAEVPEPAVVRAAMRKALQVGCAKHTNVFFIGPPNAAKTHLVASLVALFGKDSFRRPLGKTNYPMMSIHGKKVCVLEDLRAGTFGLGWDALLVWWEGQWLPVPMPQNHHKGPKDYTDAAPVFATGGDKLRIPLREALEQMVDPAVQNDMMDKRWVYFRFLHTFDGAERKSVRPCPHCFSKWLTETVDGSESGHAQLLGPAPPIVAVGVADASVASSGPAPGAPAAFGMTAHSPPPSSAPSAPAPGPFCEQCGKRRAAAPFCEQTGDRH
jgi:hypothetical protein